jgi:hypothetical protein
MINIISLAVNHVEDNTVVTAEEYEEKNSVKRMKNKFIITLAGQHSSFDDNLVNLIETELRNNGYI